MICKCSRSLSELSFHFLDLSLARTSSKMLNRSNENMDWLDLLAVQGTLKSLLQHHSSGTVE